MAATIDAGMKLGPYEIVSPLGEGGMGEVYRARDTRLNREVAIKVLPRAFAEDPNRMARFEREAQLLASLNHPKIAAIYGLEESGATRALVMELVEGPTLAERIGRAAVSARPKAGSASPAQASGGAGSGAKTGERAASAPSGARKAAIPVDEALPIAQQVAEALEYAHEHGVVHRDLKPANIKVTPDGDVKVLDFGLAKAMEPSDGSGDMANSPTLSLAMTEAGLILGTAAYMAPEQAKGKPVDRRADIWAFGCVLYEMLTGQKAFGGETVSDILAAVIMKDPDWSAFPETTSAGLQRLVRRCLQKDPRQRLQAIGDARIAIEEAISGDGGALHELPQPALAGDRISRLQRALPWGIAAFFLVTTLIGGLAYLNTVSKPGRYISSQVSAPKNIRFAFNGPEGGPSLSPDGTRLIFPAQDASGQEALWMRPLDSPTEERLEGTEGASYPFWSPDSRSVGFFQNGELKRINVTGGPSMLICNAPGARGGAWSKSGVIVFGGQGLFSVPAAGGAPSQIAGPKGSGATFSNRWPEFLPDGKHFVYLSGDPFAAGTPHIGIYIGEIGSNQAKFLLQADSDALYAPPGYLLFLRGDTLMAQRFDVGSEKPEGDALPVAEHVGSPQLYRLGLFSVSRTGLLVYSSGGPGNGGGQLVWVNAKGNESGETGPAGAFRPRLSPDGKRVAFSAKSEGNSRDIWIIDLERSVQSRLTFGPSASISPVWSPDGSRIAFASLRENGYAICAKSTSGAGSAELLLDFKGRNYPSDWSRNDRYIAFTSFGSVKSGKAGIWILPLFGDRKPFSYLETQFSERDAVFSPDVQWIAYDSDASGSFEVYLSTFPGGGGNWQVSQRGGIEPQWSRDGRELYYLAPGGKLMEASVRESGSAVEIGTPKELFQKQVEVPDRAGVMYSVAPDGMHFLVDVAKQSASPPLTLVTNWLSDLRK